MSEGRLYVRGVFTGYSRGLKTQSMNQAIVKLKVSTTPLVANGTSENELLLSTKPLKTPRSSMVKKAEAESSGAELCDHTAKAVTSKSSLQATCHPLNSPAKSELCFTKWIID